MSHELQISYHYDGSFAGFLTCLDDCRQSRVTPAEFITADDPRISLFPVRSIETDRSRATALYRSIRQEISPEAQELTACGFLTCMEEREKAIYAFLHLGKQIGPGVTRWLTDDRVAPLLKAVQYLKNEAHLLKGFVRFADYGEFLASEIEPKNRVLPLLRGHFCSRYNTENFLIYDKVHSEVLFHQSGNPMQHAQSKIIPVTHLQLPETTAREQAWQALWKTFYHTIAIEGRTNSKLRMSNVPKRYWNHMTELRDQL